MPRYETDLPQPPTPQEYANFVWEHGFVNLRPEGTPWWVVGPATWEYNCVAWTLGIKTEFIEHPEGIYPLHQVDAMYADFGFTKTAVPANNIFQPYDVLAYGPNPNEVDHVAVFLNVEGVGPTWTSKMGPAQLITHGWTQLIPGAYGNTYPAYYTHNGTMPELPFLEGETPEQTVQRLLKQYGLDRM
jgi:hypothetical protein